MVKSILTCSLSPRILKSRLHRSVYPSAKLLFASSSLNFRRPCSLYDTRFLTGSWLWLSARWWISAFFGRSLQQPIIQVASLVSIYRLSGAEVSIELPVPLTSCCEIQVGCRCLGTWVLQRRSFLRAFRRSLTSYHHLKKVGKIGRWGAPKINEAATETFTCWMPFHIGSYFLYGYIYSA